MSSCGMPGGSLTRRSFPALVRLPCTVGPGGTVLRRITEGKAAVQHTTLHSGITGTARDVLAATVDLVWTSPATTHYLYLRTEIDKVSIIVSKGPE